MEEEGYISVMLSWIDFVLGGRVGVVEEKDAYFASTYILLKI